MTQFLKVPQYESFSAVRSHAHCNGLAMMATAAPFPASASVVALHGGIDYDVIAYTVTRSGAPPQVPSPETHNRNRVFLYGTRAGAIPIPDFAGVKIYSLSGVLVFGILSPEGLASSFMLGNLPFPGIDKDEYIPGSYFQYGLINDRITQILTPVPTLLSPIRQISDLG